MQKNNENYLITGGAGFIGSNFAQYMTANFKNNKYIILDKLTYAGNLDNLKDIRNNIIFVKGDIADASLVDTIMAEHEIDVVVNFAAETHVDRSIANPEDFIKTDIYGTYVLLEASKKYGIKKFIQISTDEVYGSVDHGSSVETDALMPRNPYSASKAGADRLAYSYFATYQMPVIITRCSNNFGPYQYPEKLIPLFITNAIENKELPLYGDGRNVRDWIYVEDHARAIEFIIQNGKDGEVYNIGGGNERENREVTEKILTILNKPKSLIKPVKDRIGHDRRYSLCSDKLKALGWTPIYDYDKAMEKTINWYVNNTDWWKKIKSGEYLEYYRQHYGQKAAV
ncbi:dTDP-glucose 4,6-dehydratase [bacterium]|nr:dTDP-glucose 4,6-dehydratase [bacterium]